jgi:hypothetical protein
MRGDRDIAGKGVTGSAQKTDTALSALNLSALGDEDSLAEFADDPRIAA